MKKVKDISNQVFGSLTALEFAYINKGQAHWKFKCRCGKDIVVRANTITYQSKKAMLKEDTELPSCGCVELIRKTKHGHRSAKNTHPLYKVYRGILNRCYNENDPNYRFYGAKGVTICNDWRNDPSSFIQWALANNWKKGLHIDKDIKCMELGITPAIYAPHTCQFVKARVNLRQANDRRNYGKHPNIKLSYQDVNEIIHLYETKQMNGVELSKKFNVNSASIYRLLVLHRAESNDSV